MSPAIFLILADIVTVFHLAFIFYVVFGGLGGLRWAKFLWFHFPALLWGVFIEFSGWICPLTPLENFLRLKGGESGYAVGFIDRLVGPVLYPAGLTRPNQILLGMAVLVFNAAVYGIVIHRRHQTGQRM